MRRAKVLRLATTGPADTAPLAAAIERGEVDPATIVAIIGKTEGNGCVNDFTRGYATLALKLLLGERPVAIVMSGGTEGGLSPHLLVFCREETSERPAAGKRLAIGTAFTRGFKPEEVGRQAQIDATAEAVATAMEDAGIAAATDAHFVQIKCPLLTRERIEQAACRGEPVATDDTYYSMAMSRGASALGVALALGEVGSAPQSAICRDWSLYSGVASTSAGVELLRNEIVVLGNAAGWSGDLAIDHEVMKDAIDAEAARRLLGRLGGETVAVLAKAEASPTGEIRGRRHTMLDDSDIHSTRHARALVGGVLAGVLGDTLLYVSGGAEHQGPPGGGPLAIIARVQGKDAL
jgi:cyanuric acid amidohydrolase